eukprot:6565146-Prymnesium_polylepis.1
MCARAAYDAQRDLACDAHEAGVAKLWLAAKEDLPEVKLVEHPDRAEVGGSRHHGLPPLLREAPERAQRLRLVEAVRRGVRQHEVQ